MNQRRSKQKQAWLDSEEGRITTLMAAGMLSEALGKRLLLDLQTASLRTKSKNDADMKKPIQPVF